MSTMTIENVPLPEVSEQRAPMKLLSLSCVYPNPAEPGLGLFVRARLLQMAASAELKVVAPVPLLEYSHKTKGLLKSAKVPHHRGDGSAEVMHPRWLYPPGGTPLNSICLFLRLIGTLAGLRRDFPFQVIDAHFAYPEGVAAALLAAVFRCPFTVTLRGNVSVHGQHSLRRYSIAWALKQADRVITVSERLRQFAVSLGVDPQRVKTIPNGINTEVFSPRDRAAARLKHGIPAEAKIIFTAGELIEEKGHHHIVRALRILTWQGLDAQLLIAGKTVRGGRDYEPTIRRLVSDLGLDSKVRFLGWVDQNALAELMSAADVLCLASATEGWPNVVHEALGCGTPVVATDVGAVPDMIPSPRYGLVVPVGDHRALEQSLKLALETQWDRAAISSWAQSRTWQQVAREVIDEMRQVIVEEERQKQRRKTWEANTKPI